MPPTLRIEPASGPIAIDGALDDPGWQGVTPIEEWYETRPGNNTVPKVRSHGRLTYDHDALYVALGLLIARRLKA